MRKLLGILCILIAVASVGWKVGISFYMVSLPPDMTHIGDVSVSEGTTVKFADKDYDLPEGGHINIVKPIVLQVDRILWLLSAVLAFVAGITLLTIASSARSASPSA